MKRGLVLFLLLSFVLGISFMQINFISAEAVDSNNDGKISLGEWLRGLFKSTGTTITGLSSKESEDKDSSNSGSGNEDSIDSDDSKSSDSEKSGDNIDSIDSKTPSNLENSGGDSSESSFETEEISTTVDENGIQVEIKTKTETNEGGETKIEEEKKFIDENGNKITIITKTETKNGETETVIKRKIETPNGIEITFKTKTEIEEGRERITNSIEVKGATVETELSVREEIRDGIPRLKAELSTGAEQEIIIFPDKALQIAFDELQTTEGFIFEINEIVEDGTREAVFSAKATKPGRLLGIFNTQINLETLIDTQTGEIIKTERPWWAFLVVGQDKANVCHINEENPNKVKTLNIAITAVKAHLAHGDGVGECSATCGDGTIVEGVEACESGNTQTCTTTEGYAGSQTCNNLCTEYGECITTEFCGDGIVNGLETCDDSNVLNGDSCNSLCQIEIIENPPSATANQTNITI